MSSWHGSLVSIYLIGDVPISRRPIFGGVKTVEAVHVWILAAPLRCRASILPLDDAHVQVSITVPDTRLVNDEDLAVARMLADAVARYVAELEQLAAANRESAEDPDDGAVRADRVA
jgi:hypothetical protein